MCVASVVLLHALVDVVWVRRCGVSGCVPFCCCCLRVCVCVCVLSVGRMSLLLFTRHLQRGA